MRVFFRGSCRCICMVSRMTGWPHISVWLGNPLVPRPWHRQQMQHPAWQWHNRWWDGKGLSSKSRRIGAKLCREAMVGGKNMLQKRRIVENSIYFTFFIQGYFLHHVTRKLLEITSMKRWICVQVFEEMKKSVSKLDISHEASGLKPLWIRQYYAKRIKRIPGLDVVPVNRYHIGKPWKRWKFSIWVPVFCMFFGGWFFGLFHHSIWAKHRLRKKMCSTCNQAQGSLQEAGFWTFVGCFCWVACFKRLTWFLVEIWEFVRHHL